MKNFVMPYQEARKLLIIASALLMAFWYSTASRSFTFSLPSLQASNAVQNGQTVKVVNEESLTVDAAKKVGPSVVTVVGTPQAPSIFFPRPGSSHSDQTVGSGFIISSNGLIVTNKHVVSDASELYQVITSDDKKYDVKSIYKDPNNDIAILTINASNADLKAVTLGSSSNLQVGQYVVAIGTSLGELRNSVTSGIISGLGRGITAGNVYQGEAENLDNLIQTSAAINPGNSGGPLIDDSEQVIGINTALASDGQNVGFALPIDIVKQVLTNYKLTQFNL